MEGVATMMRFPRASKLLTPAIVFGYAPWLCIAAGYTLALVLIWPKI